MRTYKIKEQFFSDKYAEDQAHSNFPMDSFFPHSFRKLRRTEEFQSQRSRWQQIICLEFPSLPSAAKVAESRPALWPFCPRAVHSTETRQSSGKE